MDGLIPLLAVVQQRDGGDRHAVDISGEFDEPVQARIGHPLQAIRNWATHLG